jgi:hypothetical protein
MIKLFEKTRSADMSLPKAKTVHGVEIKKVPVGQYIRAMREMEELPSVIVKDLFPGKSAADIVAEFTRADNDTVILLLGRLLVVLPEHIIDALCLVIGVDKDVVMNRLTPAELCDVVREYWTMNDMSSFFGAVSALIREKVPTLATGFKSGSPLPKA